MFKPKIAISREALDKATNASKLMGASSLEEFIEKIIVSEADRIIAEYSPKQAAAVSPEEVERIAQQMKGLGYLE